ncbi:MAG TPA: SagB family peptide dehydrogenase, partial [Vicinamibacterales bacterium]|nr:SagB family peptide dehydrogenase [Vicinamibacterales bacterium]
MSELPRASVEADADALHAWYVNEGTRAQRLLDEGQIQQATEAFEAILRRLGEAPSYARAVLLGQLSRCARLGGRPELSVRRVREAMDVIGRLAPSDGVKSLRGTLRSELGDALRARGEYSEAKKAYEAALRIAEELSDLRSQGVELARLGALASAECKFDEALARQELARKLFQQLREADLEAATWHQLARIHHQLLHRDEAEAHYREAARINTERGRLAEAAQTHTNLADLLKDQPERLVEARRLAEEAFTVSLSLRPASPDTWKICGILADIAEQEARAATDNERRTECETEARVHRALHRHAAAIFAALARIDLRPTYGRAVLLGQVGHSLQMARRPDLALAPYRQAIEIVETLGPEDGLKSLRGALLTDLGDTLLAAGHVADAREAHETALAIAEELRDIRGQASATERLGKPGVAARPISGASAFELTIYDDLMTEYAFEPDLLVEGPPERRMVLFAENAQPPADDVRPVLLPCTRTWLDEEGAVHLLLPFGEPIVERQPDCTVVRRRRRELAIVGNSSGLWRLIEGMNGASTVPEIMSSFSEAERPLAARMLAALVATGAIDVSARPMGRFLHLATKKGVLPAGGLEGEDVLRLATDGIYRVYAGASRLALGRSVPHRLRAFHALTRDRRSSRVFGGGGLGRDDFDALLHTGCGVTGSMPWAGREVKLRAYPSSGALYAVEIYPVVFRVAGLNPGVYHYRAVENELEIVRPGLDPRDIVGAALPVEREMVSGAAVMICLTGCFPRHERKYGEGGYRMMVAEAGHISQNLTLAATALGLSARPFGGVFEDLLNSDLGLNTADEQFLLAVLVGPA